MGTRVTTLVKEQSIQLLHCFCNNCTCWPVQLMFSNKNRNELKVAETTHLVSLLVLYFLHEHS